MRQRRVLRAVGLSAAAACYLEGRLESAYIWKPYKQKVGKGKNEKTIYRNYTFGLLNSLDRMRY